MNDLTPDLLVVMAVMAYCIVHTAFWHARHAVNWIIAKYYKHGRLHNEVNDLLWKVGRPSAGEGNTTRIVGEDFEIVIKQWSKDDEATKKP